MSSTSASAGVYLGQFNGSGLFANEAGKKAPEPLSEPEDVAVDDSASLLTDPSSGDVYVVNTGHDVIDKFSATGEYLGELKGPPSEAFESVEGVTVDTAGNVWVWGTGKYVEGTSIENNDHLLFTFDDAAENGFVSLQQTARTGSGTNFPAFVVDTVSNDLFFATNSYGLLKMSIAGIFLEEEVDGFDFRETKGLAVEGSSGRFYVDAGESVSVFEAGGGQFKLQPTFGSGNLTAGRGLAVDSSTGAVYVADVGSDTVAKFTLLPSVATEAPSGLTGTSATLDGTVDPNGEAVTSCEFEYGTEAGVYPNAVPCEQHAVGEGTVGVPVTARVSGLQQGTIYHFRLAASHATGGFSYGEDEVVPTAPVVGGEWATDVASEGATLNAEIDRNGADTTYYFQYGTSEAYGSTAPLPDGDAGTGLNGAEVNVHVQGLQPGTIYHYRVLASSIAAPQPVLGEDRTFTTQPAGAESLLPDGREWELVSPPNKHGGDIAWQGLEALMQVSADGSAITYLAFAPTESEPRGNAAYGVQVLSTRGPDGWSSQDIATPHNEPSGYELGNGGEYKFFSADLSEAFVGPEGPFTPLSPEATERTPYVRHNFSCEATPASCYTPLATAANVPLGAKFEGANKFSDGVEFEDATPDLSHVLVSSYEASLTERTPEGDLAPNGGLYEWAAGRFQMVGVLPGGEPERAAILGDREENYRGVISNDGTRIVWVPSSNEHLLYMRDVSSEQTVQLDTPEAGAAGGESDPEFQIANSGGSRVFFTDGASLTKDSTADGEPDLYVCEMVEEAAGKLSCDLSDLTVDSHSGQHARVQGFVLGASEDGSYVYFVADGVLTETPNGEGEKATVGHCESIESPAGATCNLYVRHYDSETRQWEEPVFITDLSGRDQHDWEALQQQTSRVSPNGEFVAFMSERSLTGYDNHDAIDGAPDEEVYLYDARTSRLVCASCDPTGARPTGAVSGEESARLVDQNVHWGSMQLAATVPGWTPYRLSSALDQPRYLSNGGRLFFNSDDALVPQDANGTWDVYEYEPSGVGSCETAGVTFSERSGGCVNLISSGASAEESAFMDASESGEDVFFMTAERLVPQDFDEAFDIYDAHVCSSAAPCASARVSPPPCDTSDSCKAAPTPQPAIFGAPSSATFSGAGNYLVSPSVSTVTGPRSLTRAQRLARALKACRKRPKRKRAGCERKARRRYGAAQSRKADATKKGGR